MITITDENFEEIVLQSDIPVLVDFWAEWCMPCKSLVPIMDEIADEYKGKAVVGKIDVDANRKVSVAHVVNAIPMVLLFSKGKVVEKSVGLRSKKDFQKMLDDVIA